MTENELAAFYKARVPGKLEEMRVAVDHKDLEMLKQCVHKLRGSSGSYGYLKVSQECAVWEAELMKGSIRGSEEHLGNIQRLFEGHV